MEGATDTYAAMPLAKETRRRVENLHLGSVVDMGVVKERAQWWGPEMKARWGAGHTSPLGGVDAAIAAWGAGRCNKERGQELSADQRKLRGALVDAVGQRCRGKRFMVFEP